MSLAKRGTLYTHSGKVAFPGGAPSLVDIAISLSREGRYVGHGMRWWPVALHSFVVADLLTDEYKFDGLMHDAPESVSGDVPTPCKSDAIEEFEDLRQADIYTSLGVYLPSTEEYGPIKIADRCALCGEVYTVGTQALQDVYGREPEVEDIIFNYLDKYTYADCLESSGRVPIEFMRRFRKYKDMLPTSRLI